MADENTKSDPVINDRMASMLDAMWKRSRAQVLERLNLLDRAAAALSEGSLTSEARQEAHSTAHKLAGILGTFGFPRGTDLARQLEHDFAYPGTDAPGMLRQIAELRAMLLPETV